jgi:hypothetical protein
MSFELIVLRLFLRPPIPSVRPEHWNEHYEDFRNSLTDKDYL